MGPPNVGIPPPQATAAMPPQKGCPEGRPLWQGVWGMCPQLPKTSEGGWVGPPTVGIPPPQARAALPPQKGCPEGRPLWQGVWGMCPQLPKTSEGGWVGPPTVGIPPPQARAALPPMREGMRVRPARENSGRDHSRAALPPGSAPLVWGRVGQPYPPVPSSTSPIPPPSPTLSPHAHPPPASTLLPRPISPTPQAEGAGLAPACDLSPFVHFGQFFTQAIGLHSARALPDTTCSPLSTLPAPPKPAPSNPSRPCLADTVRFPLSTCPASLKPKLRRVPPGTGRPEKVRRTIQSNSNPPPPCRG